LFIKDLAKNITVPWTVDSMAEACGLGVTHFTYHFRRITAETPAHYLARIRLETAAKSLLQEPDSSVADIAHSCGFTRSAYFIYAFRKHFGKTPAAYRKSKKAHPTHNH
jgi:AraC family L-rhamnose operon regulatory protein RhaS